MNDIFKKYANYYDLIYQGKDYSSEARYIIEQLNRHDIHTGSILDIGCGTGRHALEFARNGFRVIGIDMSAEMIAIARANTPPDLVDKVSFEVADARSYPGCGRHDAVVSLFHVMSYQKSNDDLKNVFNTSASHLKPGGIFLFDYWFGPSVLSQKPAVRYMQIEGQDLVVHRVASPRHDPLMNSVEVNYSVFLRGQQEEEYSHFRESHTMRYLFLPEIESLSQPLFSPQSHSVWLSNLPPDESSWAAISVLKKNPA